MKAFHIIGQPGSGKTTLVVDIVLIEGWISGPFDKIEIWRECVKRPFLFPGIDKVKALVTDNPPGS